MAVTGKTKVSVTIGGLAVLAGALWAFHGFIAHHTLAIFATNARADELGAQIKTAADAAQKAAEAAQMVAQSLAVHVDQTELTEARKKLEQLKADLATTQLWEKANHPNDISTARIRELGAQIDRVSGWVACKEADHRACGAPP